MTDGNGSAGDVGEFPIDIANGPGKAEPVGPRLRVDRRARRFLGMDTAANEAEINGVKVKIVGSFALGPDFVSDGTEQLLQQFPMKRLAGLRILLTDDEEDGRLATKALLASFGAKVTVSASASGSSWWWTMFSR